jgi:UDP-N-acetylglucosamine--N-acetylmuramyl-(pentapeptide) pyrophosphoryl-undecaprenol N-acetylglucosamine transferase
MDKKIAIAGGGTGGHIFPALAIALELKKIMPEVEIKYLGKQASMEERLAGKYEIPFVPIPSRPLRRQLSLSNLLIPFTLLKGTRMVKDCLNKNSISAVLGTGGYVSVPALYGARAARVNLFLQEQNSYPGLATKLFAKYAKTVFLAYPQAEKHLSGSINKLSVGNPLRPDFDMVSREEGLKFFELNPGKKTLLIFGGSQGAEALNERARRDLARLNKSGNIQLIWQVGKHNFQSYKDSFEESGIDGVILEFIDRMEMAYASADLAFCRSGALSLSELAACKLPAILIPYPFAAEDHQYHNAIVFGDAGAAKVLRQSELDSFELGDYVSELLADENRLKQMSDAAGGMADLKASETIAGKIIEVMEW